MNVVELRQYTLHPAQRETLIELFERELVAGQEVHEMRVVGQFRDLGNPDRFVWFRAFPDMSARKRALEGFYYGPVWRANRDAANATMIDSDNVLLLRPAGPGWGFGEVTAPTPGERVVVFIAYLREPADEEFLRFFLDEVVPITGRPVAALCTEPAENTFPALPVRTGEHAFVWVCRSDDHESRLKAVTEALGERAAREPEELTLAPTERSHLR